jgi:phage shock protein E
MKPSILLALAILHSGAASAAEPASQPQPTVNPLIDYTGFVESAARLEPVRNDNLISEDEFLRMAGEPNTVILDARTPERFAQLHVKGAISLPLTDFTAANLAKLIPDKATRILIYCNNNFNNEPLNFAAKGVTVALNIQTFINLHAYGYSNVKELAPLLDVATTKIPFAGPAAPQRAQAD